MNYRIDTYSGRIRVHLGTIAYSKDQAEIKKRQLKQANPDQSFKLVQC